MIKRSARRKKRQISQHTRVFSVWQLCAMLCASVLLFIGAVYYRMTLPNVDLALAQGGPLLTVTFTINGSTNDITVPRGSDIEIIWNAPAATSCLAQGAWSGAKARNGLERFLNLQTQNPFPYTIICTGPGGSVTKSIQVNIGAASSNFVDIKANGGDTATVPYGSTVTISWTSSGLTDPNPCVMAQTWAGGSTYYPATGVYSVNPITATRNFYITCRLSNGTYLTDLAPVIVGPAPTASPTPTPLPTLPPATASPAPLPTASVAPVPTASPTSLPLPTAAATPTPTPGPAFTACTDSSQCGSGYCILGFCAPLPPRPTPLPTINPSSFVLICE